MKKMVAILVALLMLALPFASAETAFTLSDPVLSMNMGEAMTIDLTGMSLSLAAAELDDGVTAGQITISGDGNALFTLYVNVVDGTALLTADGLSAVYSAPMPADVSGIQNFEIPELNVDVEELTGILMSGIEMDDDGTIRIPYTTVNELLAAVAPALEGVEIPGIANVEDFADEVNELIESNTGVTLEGSYAETDGGMAVSAKAFLVEDGVAADTAAFGLDLSFGEDGVDLTVDAGEAGSLRFALAGEQLTIGGSAQGAEFELTGKVGTTEADIEFVELDGSNAIDLQSMTEEQGETLTNELMGAASGLLGYVMGSLGAAA